MALEKGIAIQVREFIEAGRPSSRAQSIDDRRRGYIASTVLAGEQEKRVQVEDIELEGMTFRIVSPLNASGALPAVIYFHGGCFISGGFATHDHQLRQLAYHSAGGHLALVTALRLKTTRAWQPAQLVLIYPMLDATASMKSYIDNGKDYIITEDTLLSGYEMYLSSTTLHHPEASPLWRKDFNGLPPVHILTAEYDPLRDEGEALYQRLLEQGVECTCQRYLGVIHGFFQLGGISPAAASAMRDIAWRVKSPGQ
ncbi:alpha/beta hydrolase [Klebsiella sp. S69]|uniref:alpha/beta hydrolase n=1 Tax=Klebsiella sp. S69 TaxID=2767439 RepID=UPI001903F0DA|nr:alpha/beta hydrolase [Klebsiella sp. S69]MBK0166375.1 alpha/beta hydrolase [Klebsiella sp. S69]